MADPNRPVTGYPPPNGYPAHPPPSGTAYPYAAAPPPPQQNYYYQNPYYAQNYPDPNSARRATCLRRIFSVMIGLLVIFGTITFIVWLVLRPQLPEFRVDSMSFSNFTISNNSLISFTSEVNLTAENPNKKMSLTYDEVNAAIFYSGDLLSQTMVAPFSQGTRNETSLIANFAAAGSFVDKPVLDRINKEMGGNGNVEFNFRMLSRVRYDAKAWRTRRRFLRVYCGPLTVYLPGSGRSGTLTGGLRQCRVGI